MPERIVKIPDEPIVLAYCSPVDPLALVLTENGQIYIINLRSGKYKLIDSRLDDQTPFKIRFDHSGDFLLFAYKPELHVLAVRGLEHRFILEGKGTIVDFTENQAGGVLAILDETGTVTLWDFAAGLQLDYYQFEGDVKNCSLLFTNDDQAISIIGKEEIVSFNLETGMISIRGGGNTIIETGKFDANDDYVINVTEDGALRIQDKHDLLPKNTVLTQNSKDAFMEADPFLDETPDVWLEKQDDLLSSSAPTQRSSSFSPSSRGKSQPPTKKSSSDLVRRAIAHISQATTLLDRQRGYLILHRLAIENQVSIDDLIMAYELYGSNPRANLIIMATYLRSRKIEMTKKGLLWGALTIILLVILMLWDNLTYSLLTNPNPFIQQFFTFKLLFTLLFLVFIGTILSTLRFLIVYMSQVINKQQLTPLALSIFIGYVLLGLIYIVFPLLHI